MRTDIDWRSEHDETDYRSSWTDLGPWSSILRKPLWASVWCVACFLFCVATYYKSLYVSLDDLEYSLLSVGVAALSCLCMTYISSKPERFGAEPTRSQLRYLLTVFGIVLFAAGSVGAALEANRASWPTAEGTVLRHLKRRGVTVLEVEFTTDGERRLGRCGLVGPSRRYTWLNSDFAPGRAMKLRFDSEQPSRIDLDVAVCDRLGILVSMFVLPSMLFLCRAHRMKSKPSSCQA